MLSRVHIQREHLDMAKYKIGDMVMNARGDIGIVRAIFTTIDGEPRYAVENEGTLDFVDEDRLSLGSQAHLAA